MSAEHNHPPACCCFVRWPDEPDRPAEDCPGCPEHGDLATPYTEQETTK